MANIKKLTGGWRAMRAKIDQLVQRVNALSNLTVLRADADEEIGERVQVGIELAILNLKHQPEGGGDGFQIFWTGGGNAFVSYADAIVNYNPDIHDHCFLKLTVISGKFNESTVSEAISGSYILYDGDASVAPVEDQSYYRVPIIIDGKTVSTGGSLFEETLCDASKGLNQIAVKLG